MEELFDLCLVPGVSGREEAVREKIACLLGGYDGKALTVDRVGNLTLGIKGQHDAMILVLAHMDEIGFYVTTIRDDGKLVVRNVGGVIDDTLPGSYVEVVTKNGSVDGVFGAVPPHLRDDGVQFERVVDVGALSKDEVSSLGIEIMDFVVFKKFPTVLNGKMLSVRSLDDRFGCYALVKASEGLSPRCSVTFAWTVQEEVGLRGAKALSHSLSPSLAIAIDSFACCGRQNKHIRPGAGPVIRAFDNSSISDSRIVKRVCSIAESAGIPLQIGATGGGNDASVFFDKGVPVLALSVPVLYLHSQVEMIHIDDLRNLISLLRAVFEALEPSDLV